MMMDVLSCRCLCAVLGIVLHHLAAAPPCSGSFEVHLAHGEKAGSVVFNASLGAGWFYEVDRLRSGDDALRFLDLDSSSGHVLLSRTLDCRALSTRTTRLCIDSRTYSRRDLTLANFTVTSLSVYVHGPSCYQNHRRKEGGTAGTRQLIVLNLYTEEEGAHPCLTCGRDVVSLKRFLPESANRCLVGALVYNTRDYLVRGQSHVISTKTEVCPFGNTLTINGDLEFECMKRQKVAMPFSIVLHMHSLGEETPEQHFRSWNGESSQKIRLKREVTNNAPRFAKTSYKKEIAEEQNPGVITIITAEDLDSEDAGTLTYSLLATRDHRSQAMFAIEPASGTISTTRKLDRENIAVHFFMIIAVDNGRPQKSGTASLTIKVTDINDHTPHFEKNVYSKAVNEAADDRSIVITVRATDEDFGENAVIRYSILNPTGSNAAFVINSVLGSIKIQKRLDRETIDNYELIVQACDQGDVAERRSSTATVQITVLDENDNRPQFSQASYRVDVPEDKDTSIEPVILRISAIDKDEGLNSQIIYSISGGNSQGNFQIDSQSGELSLLHPLDFENSHQYSLNIRAQDKGSPPRTNSTTVLVRVLDVNDNNPEFFTPLYQKSVMENEPVYASILEMNAFDADSGVNAELSYEIKNAPLFLPLTIDSKSGLIRTTAVLDRENASSFTFFVEAKDNGTPPHSATATVILTIRDANDNPPIFNPRVYNVTVSEEVKPGTRAVIVTATDKDEGENAVITYKITNGNIDNAFNIIITHMGKGVISVAKVLNYGEHSHYILTVTATDSGKQVDTAEVFIKILDTNRYRPVFQNIAQNKRVPEDVAVGTSVFNVFALDSDVGENARVTYMMEGNPAFAIDPNTGEVKTRLPLDREIKAVYSLTVTAKDQGKPPKSDTAVLEILIEDVNDNPPEFTEVAYSGTAIEDAVVGVSVTQIVAKDRDAGRNGQIYYTFNKGNDGNRDFMIDEASGVIRIAKDLDRERTAHYELVAYAVDRGAVPLSTSVTIHINVQDVNDNRPEFESHQIDVWIAENSPRGSTVAQLTANDPDEGINAQVEYVIQGGKDKDAFDLNGRPGSPAIIISLIDLDYESNKKTYELILRAISKPLFSDVTVIIHVRDINDNAPRLQDFTIIFNNFLNHFPTGVIGNIPAHDPDEMDRNKLRYSFITGNEGNLLHLNGSTGELHLDSRLNSDVPRNGTFQIRVSDGLNVAKATCQLYVRLVTDDMLHNSVTIRLNNMTKTAFLSPLFNFFVDALATIIHTDQKYVFVINVQDDTDVRAQILNVSVSVWKTIFQGKDVYYTPQFLQEQIYLQRMLLANLSTLQVLPFDDNLCIQEPCINFEVCQTKLVFGSATAFISSESMLFRPIHPTNGYRCECPRGFTGMTKDFLCDVEVNLCYSSPCGMTGTCMQREGGYTCLCISGFTGKHCETDMMASYEKLTCPQNVCQPPSSCEVVDAGGFYCKGCPSKDYYNKFCQLTTQHFSRGSYLTFPSLKRRYRFTIQLQFATREKNGILFYNGRFNEKHDFIALEIVNNQIQFSFSLGTNVTSVVASLPGGISDGEWHQVSVKYLNKTVILTIGEDCDAGVAINYRHLFENYKCASSVTLNLPDRCFKMTEICYRLLDLTGPLQIGGLPQILSAFQIQNKDFVGCIKDFYIDHVLLDLNTSVSDHLTKHGCSLKQKFCLSSPCKNGGTCHEGWGTYLCDCPDRSGGKDCSQVIEAPCQFNEKGYLFYDNPSLPKIKFPWYNGIAFRTRAKTGVLMQIIIQDADSILIQLNDGFINYLFGHTNTVFDAVHVNDGKWHYFEIRWYQTELILILDYGQLQQEVDNVDNSVVGKEITRIYVGAQRQNGNTITSGFTGCIENVRVGNSANSLLHHPRESNVVRGCTLPSACTNNPCKPNRCIDEWGDYSCQCLPGRIGTNCTDVCDNFNPCQNMGICQRPSKGEKTYTCECGRLQYGRYCENSIQQPCPATWWGYPVCGPCNCSTSKGFNSVCNKTKGACSCKENHYRPVGSNKCYPCNCYPLGSKGMLCNPLTGKCNCIKGVVGRRCDSCSSQFAEVTEDGCTVVYDSCPKNFASGVWWENTAFGNTAVQGCPSGSVGIAKRNCTRENSWGEPDVFNCTSLAFLDLQKQLQYLESGDLMITTYVAKTLVVQLAAATPEILHGNDLDIIFRLVMVILKYENQLQGLNLTSEQDRNFIQNILTALSYAYNPQYSAEWGHLNKNGGAMELMHSFEMYLKILATSMAVSQSWPFDVVSENIVLGVDSINKLNFTGSRIPKYDNIVQKYTMFDKDSHITLPRTVLLNDLLSEPTAMPDNRKILPKAYVGYIMYRTIGDILPMHFDRSVRNIVGRPLAISSSVISIILRDKNLDVSGYQVDPINITFKQSSVVNRSSPQCVYWQFEDGNFNGHWSRTGCKIVDRYSLDEDRYVVCSCNHLSTYALLMDMTDSEYLAAAAINMEVITYIGLVIAMLCLLLAFFIFFCLKNLQSNSNSIHINMVLTIFIAELSFVIGVNNTDPEILCRIIAIFLHYFYISAFAWMFVEVLHLYRMLTEIREINHGSMKFYYLVGYVIPGIIVGLAVGLYTDHYGTPQFCWLSTRDMFIWSFAGPIAFVVLMNVITFILAVQASCREKLHVGQEELSMLRLGLLASILLLPLAASTWVFALLSVNQNHVAFHYLFAIMACFQGVFIFVIYVMCDKHVRFELKRVWYKCRGKKLEMDETLAGTRSTMLSRSALAYRHDSSADGGLHRINIGISTTSTTSRSTSKTSSGGLYKGDEYLRGTNSSTSGNIPSASIYPPNTGIPPYDSHKSFYDKHPDDPDTGEKSHNKQANDSDSDSDASVDRASMELASSHSSDEDEDFDVGPKWDQQLPKSKVVEKAREQARLTQSKKKKQSSVAGTPGSQTSGMMTTVPTGPELQSPDRLKASRTPTPRKQYPPSQATSPAQRESIVLNNFALPAASEHPLVQVLTHNGSISSDSECSNTTMV